MPAALSLAQPLESPESIALRAKKVAARVLNLCHTLEGMRDDFIPLLPTLRDEVIIEVRMGARAIGVWSWVIECACDAEMFERVEAAKRGPKVEGEEQDENAGKVAAAGQQAYLDGKSVTTVYRNAQIFNTFGLEFISTHGKELQEKGFWIAALSADDPIEAVETLAEKKVENPFMEVQEAYRVLGALKDKHERAKGEFIEAFRSVGRKVKGEWIKDTARPAIQALKLTCPDTELSKMLDEVEQQLQEREEVMLIEDAEPALILAWEKGWRTEAKMCEFTRLLPLEIRSAMLSLQERGYFVEQEVQWKTRMAKGKRGKEWQRTNKPLPTIHVVPPAA